MKQIVAFSLLCLLCVLPLSAQTPATAPVQALRNEDIGQMLDAKLAPALIVAKIKVSPCAFDTGIAALQTLKAQGAPDEVLLAMVNSAQPSVTNATRAVKIPDRTPIALMPMQAISSEEVQKGDLITFRVAHSVKISDVVVIEEGALAFGRVTLSTQGRSFGRAGKLDWAMEDVTAVDKNKVPLTFARHISGKSKGGTATATAVATGLLFPPLALLSGFTRGKPAILPAGHVFEAFTNGEATVNVTTKN